MNLEFEGLYPDHGGNLFVKWRHSYYPNIKQLLIRDGIVNLERADDNISKY